MWLTPRGRPNQKQIQDYMLEFKNGLFKSKTYADRIMAVEKKLKEKKEQERNFFYTKHREEEHKRVQKMIDLEEISPSDLMPQETKLFISLRGNDQKDSKKVARCESISLVKSTEALNERFSIFLSKQFIDNTMQKDFKQSLNETEEEKETLQGMYDETQIEELVKAQNVYEMYRVADELIGVTEDGCKDLIILK